MFFCSLAFPLVFGRVGLNVMVWLLGSVALLPQAGRDIAWSACLWLKAEKDRIFGKGKILLIISSLWQRIPDSVEANHLDLFEIDVCLPERGTP